MLNIIAQMTYRELTPEFQFHDIFYSFLLRSSVIALLIFYVLLISTVQKITSVNDNFNT